MCVGGGWSTTDPPNTRPERVIRGLGDRMGEGERVYLLASFLDLRGMTKRTVRLPPPTDYLNNWPVAGPKVI